MKGFFHNVPGQWNLKTNLGRFLLKKSQNLICDHEHHENNQIHTSITFSAALWLGFICIKPRWTAQCNARSQQRTVVTKWAHLTGHLSLWGIKASTARDWIVVFFTTAERKFYSLYNKLLVDSNVFVILLFCSHYQTIYGLIWKQKAWHCPMALIQSNSCKLFTKPMKLSLY